MRLPSRARIGELARWIFFPRGERRSNWRGFKQGIAIILVAGVMNTVFQQMGLYDQLEWVDLDRHQQTASTTGAGDVALVLIDDDDYQALFNATSPLDPDKLATLIAAVCQFSPRVVGVDILTSDWPADSHDTLVMQRLAGCPLVWVSDILETTSDKEGANGPLQLRPGKTIGQALPPPDTCTAVSILQPDADGIIRRYALSYPGMTSGAPSLASHEYPTIVAMLAGYGHKRMCTPAGPSSGDTTVTSWKIRYTSNETFTNVPASHVLEAASNVDEPLHESLTELLGDRIVIVGGAYRYARDKHPTPIGPIHGAELIANAVYTQLEAPISDLPWWLSLALDIVVSLALLLALVWSGLRWPWATLGSLILSAAAAALISWSLYNYMGYFLGVLSGLMGVVLAELTSIVWKPLNEMWRGWLREYPTLAADIPIPQDPAGRLDP